MELWFATRPAAIPLLDQVEAKRPSVIPVDGPAMEELAEISRFVGSEGRRRPFEAVVVDHYGLGADWLTGARRLAKRRIVIDDLADRPLPSEVLVNPSLGVTPDDYAGLIGPATRLLLGTRYVPLRPAFCVAISRTAAPEVTNVLVTMGGSDTVGATREAVDAARVALPTARIDVVLGALHGGDPVQGPGVHVHQAIGDQAMARLMQTADIAVGAGGTTSWERCALGLPTVIVRVARNQDAGTERLARAGAAMDAGPLEGVDVTSLATLIRRLADDAPTRQAMSDRARGLVDGRGVERLANHIDGIRVRRATMADADLLLRWRNDPATRAASLEQAEIPLPAHRSWLRGALGDPARVLLIGVNGTGPVGHVRFDRHATGAEVSITVAPELRGTIGGLLLERAIQRFRLRSPRGELTAQVRVDNEASRRLFERSGFRLAGDRAGILLYHAVASADATPALDLPAEP
jgi:spore coat polysaccharide biosynthesis predicted glycosyltransferase SpsG/RimJ/RimL family protein N-acetyltransferase